MLLSPAPCHLLKLSLYILSSLSEVIFVHLIGETKSAPIFLVFPVSLQGYSYKPVLLNLWVVTPLVEGVK